MDALQSEVDGTTEGGTAASRLVFGVDAQLGLGTAVKRPAVGAGRWPWPGQATRELVGRAASIGSTARYGGII